MCFRPPTAELADNKCPECGADNLLGVRKCKHCGADLTTKVAGTSAPDVHEATSSTVAAPGVLVAPAAPAAPAVPGAPSAPKPPVA